MSCQSIFAGLLFTLIALGCNRPAPAGAADSPQPEAAVRAVSEAPTGPMEPTDAARQFLSSLTPAQRKAVVAPFADAGREQWHYVPDGMWQRGGLTIGELTADQQAGLHTLLRAYLSQAGYQKTLDVIALEGILAQLENNPTYRDPERYHISFYGDPAASPTSPWSWKLEGHHLSLNFTVVGDTIAYAPRFYGANPATVPRGERAGFRALKSEADLGLQLINSLTAAQQKTAILQATTYRDIVSGHAPRVSPLSPRGLAATELTPAQHELLFRLIDAYLSALPGAVAEQRLALIRANERSDLHFAWAGATEAGRPHYYRLQGQSFLIEFDNSQNGGNHIHTVWRDFDGDFGRDLLREHYHSSGHH